jgi:riboflavin synthase
LGFAERLEPRPQYNSHVGFRSSRLTADRHIMFTGIIEELGTVERARSRLTIRARLVLSDLAEGASIAVNGVCLTAIDIKPHSFSADLSPETLERTNLGDLRHGDQVNLERPLLPTSRLSGHIVQGHVDGTGELMSLEELRDGNWWLKVRVPRELDRYLVFKGSIAIDGISLTIAGLEDFQVGVAIVPHTYQMTNLASRRRGQRVNIECDMIAKHVEKLVAAMDLTPASSSAGEASSRPARRLTVGRLQEEGF